MQEAVMSKWDYKVLGQVVNESERLFGCRVEWCLYKICVSCRSSVSRGKGLRERSYCTATALEGDGGTLGDERAVRN